ncbi:MAG: NERD domain-containing protein [Chloroflexi bacterium]|nr:NERD domain-containing protein [Chloroflexota bacterium]
MANLMLYQLVALAAGWTLSQIGIYLSHRYLRRPRPDEVLDEAVKKVARNGRFYHYLLPVPHILLTPEGVTLFIAKYQGGEISVEGDRWKQKGVGIRKFFGQEGIGNPTKEAEARVDILDKYLRKHAPDVEKVPIAPMIVFTSKGVHNLDVKTSRIPAMHYTKVKGYLRQHKRKPMPQTDYDAIRAAFDAKAARLIEAEI